MTLPVTLVEKSQNSKLGNIGATYAPIEQTCPDSCELKDKVCYAQSSFVGIQNARLTKMARKGKYTALQLARMEAKLIATLPEEKKYKTGQKPLPVLRLHVSGDSRTIKGTRLLSKAASKYIKAGGKVYSYTHAWKKVPRNAWGNVSILASVDSIAEADEAAARGYVPAIVVEKFDGKKAFKMEGSNVSFIPCPNQTIDLTCEECMFCMRADSLKLGNKGIAFAVHGVQKGKYKLKVVK